MIGKVFTAFNDLMMVSGYLYWLATLSLLGWITFQVWFDKRKAGQVRKQHMEAELQERLNACPYLVEHDYDLIEDAEMIVRDAWR